MGKQIIVGIKPNSGNERVLILFTFIYVICFYFADLLTKIKLTLLLAASPPVGGIIFNYTWELSFNFI